MPALRVTFDGWVVQAGAAAIIERLSEREYCSLAGVLAAAVAVAELFFSFAEISIEAGRHAVSLSRWRPDMEATDAEALGISNGPSMSIFAAAMMSRVLRCVVSTPRQADGALDASVTATENVDRSTGSFAYHAADQ